MRFKRKMWGSLVVLLPLLATACANYANSQQLTNLVDQSKATQVPNQDAKSLKSAQLVNSLLSRVFPQNQAALDAFVTQQNDSSYQTNLWNQIRTITQNYLAAEGEKRLATINELQTLYSENWYFVLNQLDQFDATFDQWWLFNNHSQRIFHSSTYIMMLENLFSKDQMQLNSTKIASQSFDDLVVGEESVELQNSTIFYLRSGKGFLRITVTNERTPNPTIRMQPFWISFPYAVGQTISLHLISNLYHLGQIHGDQAGYERFEQDMVHNLRYGPPVQYLLLKTS